MAATAEAARLTEAHRLAQSRLGAQVVRQMLLTWPLLDIGDLDRTFERWLRVVVPLVQANRRTSSALAANYIRTFRVLELGVDTRPIVPVIAEPAPVEAVTTSMLVTGPAALRANLAKKVPLERAMSTAAARSARSAMRHVLAGGRETIDQTVANDSRALGWARATSAKACHFCAMLASRGPVYSEATVGFHAHDGCSCSAEPVYRRDADWPAGSRRYRDLWNEATTGQSGADAQLAFRQALAGG